MSKCTTKRRITDREKTQAVYWVAKLFNCTPAYVYASLTHPTPYGAMEDIKKAFEKKYQELKAVMA